MLRVRRKISWLIILVALGGIVILAPSSGLNVIRDISYVPQDKSSAHTLDLYLPAYRAVLEKPRPLIIWIHGGGWDSGSKSDSPGTVLPQLGYICASINYRLTDQATYPAQLEDCQNAIRFLRDKSRQYRIDPKKVGVWGLSAGGHLAALVGLGAESTTEDMNADKSTAIKTETSAQLIRDSTKIQAVCDWAGPSDLLAITKQCGPKNQFHVNAVDGPIAKLLGGLPESVPEKAKLASPVTFVHVGAPPFFILHGDDDEVIPVQQSIELSKLLRRSGNDCTLRIVPGGKHKFYSENSVGESIKFFDRCLK
jgi:acetyl esterase/lipase